MWFLLLLTFVNALAHNSNIALRYRINVGFPVGIFDALLALGLLVAIVDRRNFVATDRTHPLLGWIVIAFGAATLAGAFGAMSSNVELRWLLTAMRNWITMPMSVLIGYFLLPNPRSAGRFTYLHVLAGVGTALFILLFFRSKAQDSSGDINLLRAVAYVTNYAGLAATLLLFTIIGRIPMFPAWLAIGLCGFCFIGQLATLSRSDWLATTAGVLAIYFLLPSFRPRGKLVAALVGPPLIALFVWVGLLVASAATGRDFEKQMADRVVSMLPGERSSPSQKKAWDTRLSSALQELRWWAKSPVTGGGFGIHDAKRGTLSRSQMEGLRHNTWVSTLAETGILGFGAMACVVIGTVVVGRRVVRDALDRDSVLVGALAVITGSHFLFHGLATMSFNQMRWAIPLGVVCGVILRTRAMQLTQIRMMQQAYYEYSSEDEYSTAGNDPGWSAVA